MNYDWRKECLGETRRSGVRIPPGPPHPSKGVRKKGSWKEKGWEKPIPYFLASNIFSELPLGKKQPSPNFWYYYG
jgi:hypothetical protein